MPADPGDVLLRVVHDLVGTEGPGLLRLARTADGRHVSAQGLRDLDRVRPHTAGRPVHEDALSRLHARLVP